MFNLGFSELIVIAVLALIFIGPKQLPEIARVVGRLLNEFRRATSDLTTNFSKVRDETRRVVKETEDEIVSHPAWNDPKLLGNQASSEEIKREEKDEKGSSS